MNFMEKPNNQHVAVPSVDLKSNGLENIDPYVYACIKRYMNAKTKQSFPSLQSLIKDSQLSKSTIVKSIKRLELAGFIKVIKEFGKSNTYVFNDVKKFEMFSYDFLDKKELTPKEKAYLVASQQFMFKGEKLGGITFSSQKLADNIGLSLNTLKKCEQSLEEKGILTKNLIKRDNATGLGVYERVYDFEKFANVVALKFYEQDEKLDQHEYRIKRLEQQLKMVLEENERLKQQLTPLRNPIILD